MRTTEQHAHHLERLASELYRARRRVSRQDVQQKRKLSRTRIPFSQPEWVCVSIFIAAVGDTITRLKNFGLRRASQFQKKQKL